MSLDEQLAELLAQLGVTLEDTEAAEHGPAARRAPFTYGARLPATARNADLAAEMAEPPEVSLFQTSREHYGVFYRLDLVGALPQLRVFLPEDEGALKMRCYLVRAALGTPLHEWFVSARGHDGSSAYDDARDMAQQHLLFAVGELMKRLFWGGDPDQMRFPEEVEVLRLA
jgi:hypothetical protein